MNVKKQVKELYKSVEIEEGFLLIRRFFMALYLKERMNVKQMALELGLPIPVVSAIKNEAARRDLVIIGAGMTLSDSGRTYVEEVLGMNNVDKEALRILLDVQQKPEFLDEVLAELDAVYQSRPEVDVTLDQSKCTAETGLKRALLMLRSHCMIGSRILCVGDDDFVSIAIALLVKSIALRPEELNMVHITVIDIDQRVLEYIEKTAEKYQLPIVCRQHDLRCPLPEELQKGFDTAVMDPPYTIPGTRLFLERGLAGLREDNNLSIFLSVAQKNPQFQITLQKEILELKCFVWDRLNQFNQYDGAQILGGVSDMYILQTIKSPRPMLNREYRGLLYTGDYRRTKRVYQCMQCRQQYAVGQGEENITIERLKHETCSNCGGDRFRLLGKWKKEG